jgi:hypothetical protein
MTNNQENPNQADESLNKNDLWWLNNPLQLRPGMRFLQEGRGITLILPVFGSRTNSWYGKYDDDQFVGTTAVLSSFEQQLETDPEAEIFAIETCEAMAKGRNEPGNHFANLVAQWRREIENKRRKSPAQVCDPRL